MGAASAPAESRAATRKVVNPIITFGETRRRLDRRAKKRSSVVVWHKSCYAEPVARSLHVRLDDSSDAALAIVRDSGEMSDSEAVRTALREAAARRRSRSAIAAEVARLMADDGDREEMRVVREQMADLAPDLAD